MSSHVGPIRGKVARVLNSREVALNNGASDGVEVGMVFNILNSKGSEIRDPDTGEVLGAVELPKTKVKVTMVQDRVSVASTFRTRRVNVGGSGLGFRRMFEPPKWETHTETFNIDESDRPGGVGRMGQLREDRRFGSPVSRSGPTGGHRLTA